MKILRFLLFILLFLILPNSVCAFDKTLKVYDYAQVLSVEEEKELKELSDKYIKKYSLDLVIVTVKHQDFKSTMDYAKKFYNVNEFGKGKNKDGLLFAIDFTYKDTTLEIYTSGYANKLFDVNKMKKKIKIKSNEDYLEIFKDCINESSNYMLLEKQSNNKEGMLDKVNFLLIFLISFSLTSIITLIFIIQSKIKTGKRTKNNYLKDKNTSIVLNEDKFITTHTTSIRLKDLLK